MAGCCAITSWGGKVKQRTLATRTKLLSAKAGQEGQLQHDRKLGKGKRGEDAEEENVLVD